MRRLNHRATDERGNAAITVGLLMIVLLGAAAIAVDVTAMHQERRELQNGADAAALAVAEDCAAGNCGPYMTTADHFGDANAGDDRAYIEGVTIDMTAQTAKVDDRTDDAAGGTQLLHWFAQFLGTRGTTVRASATARWGVAWLNDAVPLTVSRCELDGTPPESEVVLTFHEGNATDPATSCSPGPGSSGQDLPGGFGWLVASNCEAIFSSPEPITEHGKTFYAKWVGSQTGNTPPKSCKDEGGLDYLTGEPFLISLGDEFYSEYGGYLEFHVPVFDIPPAGQGANGEFRIVGFATLIVKAFRLTSGSTSSQSTWAFDPDGILEAKCPSSKDPALADPGAGGKPAGPGGGGPGDSADTTCLVGEYIDDVDIAKPTALPGNPNFGTQTVELIA